MATTTQLTTGRIAMALTSRASDESAHPLLTRILAAKSPEELAGKQAAVIAAIDRQRRNRLLTKKVLRLFEVPHSEWDCFEDLVDVLKPLGLHLDEVAEAAVGFPESWRITLTNPYGSGTNALLAVVTCSACHRTVRLVNCLRLWELKSGMRAHRCGESA